MKHSFEEKLNINSILREGYPLRRLCIERGLDHHDVIQWRLRYEAKGEDGLREMTNASIIPPKQRESIVRVYRKVRTFVTAIVALPCKPCNA